ncbi:nitroreductase family deazaflavin-dependent oxidoreductase [Kitasatospora sp. NPDC056184]|uniref:nitroreductase family deazaflavin-dependent oxidoreductase n=1 Tax=Kitasatospora sp. NPDC056184 TaxID=3345738 RepID=UPI0035DD6473
MPLEGEYEPSPAQWIREQVELYESSGGTRGTTLWDTGLPVVIVTMRGAKSGRIHKIPLMRVEHEGCYAAVASKGGFPRHPDWYVNLKANPRVDLQDGPERRGMTAREVTGDERTRWWRRAVAAYPTYAEYQEMTDRVIPVFVLEPERPAGPANGPAPTRS